MAVFVLRRLLRSLLCLLAVSVLAFALLQAAPGDFAAIQRVSGGTPGTGAAVGAWAVNAAEPPGGGTPGWQHYLVLLRGAVSGDLGTSYLYPNRTVAGIVGQGFAVSAQLGLLALLLALLVALPLGTLSAVRHRTGWDRGVMLLVTVGQAVPAYLLALLLTLLLANTLHLLPTGGWTGPADMVLPVVTLAAAPTAVLARHLRASLVATLSADYVAAAYAKGGSPAAVVCRHALRNSLLPLLTVAGSTLATLMAGSVLVETVFGIPGLGRYFADAARARDLPLLMGCTLLFAALVMSANLLVDVVHRLLDPRLRLTDRRPS